MIPFEERRINRSNYPAVALEHQLEHVRDRGRLEALILSDEQGLPVAIAGNPGVCEELAAMAPLLARSPMGMHMSGTLRGADVTVRTVTVHDQPLYLASIGGGVARDALLTHSLRGVKRILSSN